MKAHQYMNRVSSKLATSFISIGAGVKYSSLEEAVTVDGDWFFADVYHQRTKLQCIP